MTFNEILPFILKGDKVTCYEWMKHEWIQLKDEHGYLVILDEEGIEMKAGSLIHNLDSDWILWEKK